MLIRIILILILGYILYNYFKKILLSSSNVKGQARSRENQNKKYSNIEDADYEEIDK